MQSAVLSEWFVLHNMALGYFIVFDAIIVRKHAVRQTDECFCSFHGFPPVFGDNVDGECREGLGPARILTGSGPGPPHCNDYLRFIC